jgi:hypothetical protein
MENGLFLIGLLIALFALYRLVSRRLASPAGIVRGLLRRYHGFERTGLPEQECLLKMLTSRSHWKNLPHGFLAEIVARLQSKENVIRFVSLAEGYGFDRKDFPVIAKKENLEAAMREVACLLGNFGDGLQKENRFKEAEFVQKLAFGLQPDQYFTELPLAVTYYKMERYADAVPLFKKGLVRLEKLANGANPMEKASLPFDGSKSAANLKELRGGYQEMYAACVKGASLGES